MIHKYVHERAKDWGHAQDKVLQLCSSREMSLHELDLKPRQFAYQWKDITCEKCLELKGENNDIPNKNRKTRRYRRAVV